MRAAAGRATVALCFALVAARGQAQDTATVGGGGGGGGGVYHPPGSRLETRRTVELRPGRAESMLFGEPVMPASGALLLVEGGSMLSAGSNLSGTPMNAFLGGQVSSVARGPWRTEFAGGLSYQSDGSAPTASTNGFARGRVELASERSGAWLGGGGRMTTGEASRRTLFAEAGGWHRWGGLLLEGSLSSSLHVAGREYAFVRSVPDSEPLGSLPGPGWERVLVDAETYHDADLSLGYAHRALALRASFGARFLDALAPAAQWGSLESAFWVTPQIALLARYDMQSGLDENGHDHSNTGSFGVRLASLHLLSPPSKPQRGVGAAELTTERLGAHRYALVMFAPGAQRVELTGDLTEWKPIMLQHEAGGAWRIVLPLAPGLYRVNVRVDGGPWRTPSGLPARDDDFNGRVALLSIG